MIVLLLLYFLNLLSAAIVSALIPQPLLPLWEKGSKTNFIVPLSPFGRGARGEGFI
jgi:hypothetical protein